MADRGVYSLAVVVAAAAAIVEEVVDQTGNGSGQRFAAIQWTRTTLQRDLGETVKSERDWDQHRWTQDENEEEHKRKQEVHRKKAQISTVRSLSKFSEWVETTGGGWSEASIRVNDGRKQATNNKLKKRY